MSILITLKNLNQELQNVFTFKVVEVSLKYMYILYIIIIYFLPAKLYNLLTRLSPGNRYSCKLFVTTILQPYHNLVICITERLLLPCYNLVVTLEACYKGWLFQMGSEVKKVTQKRYGYYKCSTSKKINNMVESVTFINTTLTM